MSAFLCDPFTSRWTRFLLFILASSIALTSGLRPGTAQPHEARAGDLPELLLFSGAESVGEDRAPQTVRRRRVEVDRGLLERLSPGQGAQLRFTPFADTSFAVRLTESKRSGQGISILLGEVTTIPGSSFLLAVDGDTVLANLWAPGRGSYHLRPLSDGGFVARQIDGGAFPRCGGAAGTTPVTRSPGRDFQQSVGGFCADDGSMIDLLVVYTPAAKDANGGTAGIEGLIALAETSTNVAYANSLIQTRVRVVGTQEVAYVESGSGTIDRQRLTDPDDGFMDEVHDARDLAGADVVTLINNTMPGLCGIAHFSILAGNVPVPSLGFNVVRADCAVDNFSFAHELGHNQGCRHDRGADNSDLGAFLYSHGYKEPGGVFRTVMAVFNSVVPRVQHFSNPDVLFSGLPTGVPIGQSDSAHNALTIDQTSFNVANFRSSVPQDCNGNGVADNLDIVNGTSEDVNDNGVPDECEAGRFFVDADAIGFNDGSSWADAYNDLQDAIDAASDPCAGVSEIWVASGTYRPDRGTGDRSGAFRLSTGLSIYGGFSGTETNRNQRDPSANPTILSGDLLDDDGPGFSNDGENSFHVVDATGSDPSALLDGFTIRGGNANGVSPNNNGGGILSDGGSAVIRRCLFSSNRASTGAGALALLNSADVMVRDSVFVGNRAGNQGGAMFVFRSAPLIVNCVFTGNTAQFRGGAITNSIDGEPVVLNCSFSLNDANQFQGGAWHNLAGSAVIGNSVFHGNSDGVATGEAAQIFVGGGSVAIDHSLVEGLTGGLGGSGNIGSDPLFADADLRLSAGSPAIDAGDNGVIPLDVSLDLDGNTRRFDDPATPDTGLGTPPLVDMGAFEFGSQVPPRRYVDLDAASGGDGLTWPTAFRGVQEALDAAFQAGGAVDEIWVAEGTYVPSARTIPGEPRSATFSLVKGVSVYGGFSGDETDLLQRRSRNHRTVLSGDFAGNDGPGFLNNDENAFHVVTAVGLDPTKALLDGFVITGGNAEGQVILFGQAQGGGALLLEDGGLVVESCTFLHNVTSGQGGAVLMTRASGTSFGDCFFLGNEATSSRSSGGAVASVNSKASFDNTVFSGNRSFGSAGAAVIYGGGGLTFTGCTLSHNRNAVFRGAFSVIQGFLSVTNCILWGNQGDGGGQIQTIGALIRISYSDIDGLLVIGPGNINQDPLFVDPDGADDVFGTEDDNVRLMPFSPCIDAGSNFAVPATTGLDLDGNARFFDDLAVADTGLGTPPIVDMGSYERVSLPDGVRVVDDDAVPGGDGKSWGTAFDNLDSALAAAAGSGGAIDEIWVACGRYAPSVESEPGTPRTVTFQLLDGVALYGGFEGNELERIQRAGLFDETVLSGDLLGDDIGFVNNGENAFHVVTGSGTGSSAVLDGFRVTGGFANGGCCDHDRGAGFLCLGGSPTLANCSISDNAASPGFGAGVLVDGGSPTFSRCEISGNSGKQGAGVSFSSGSTAVLTDCIIRDNTAPGGNGGGARSSLSASPTYINCLFFGNSAGAGGGGGLDVLSGGTTTLINCTIADNVATHPTVGSGGGIAVGTGGNVVLANCVLWDNSDLGGMDESAQLHLRSGALATVTYTDIQGLTGVLGGIGNLGSDPLFVAPGSGDYRLSAGSPCLDAADNTAVPGGVQNDLDGNPRFVDDPAAVDTGNGTPPLVDMGSYEGQG